MKEDRLFAAITDIDDHYIVEAGKLKREEHHYKRILPLAACIVAFVGSICYWYFFMRTAGTYKVMAAEIGREEIQIESTMPTILYYESDIVIMYDYVGIWVYDLSARRLVGFCDFQACDMTQIQGNPCVFVEVSRNGKYVRFYKSDGTVKYLYDVEKDQYREVETYPDSLYWGYTLEDVSNQYSLSEYAPTYRIAEDEYLTYVLDYDTDMERPAEYKDLVLVMSVNGKLVEYRPFTE